MNDFVSDFWGNYVTVLVVASIAFCVIVLVSQSTRYVKDFKAEVQGHVWDGDIAEYNNPLPRWWKYLFWITIAFSAAYLALYPGLGKFSGNYGWTSAGQYEAEMARANEKYGPIFEKFQKQDLKAVAADPEARAMGQRLFLTYCAQCHGSDARGARGFPNLTDNDWLYGGEPEVIKASIMDGRQGMMPPFGPQLSGDQIRDVANYVRSLSGLATDSLRVARGKEIFQTNCVACHGPEGKGQFAMGAPNLTDKTWLYGSAESTIVETVTKGRSNRMPSHKDFLGDAKVHLLAAYVYGLSAEAQKK